MKKSLLFVDNTGREKKDLVNKVLSHVCTHLV